MLNFCLCLPIFVWICCHCWVCSFYLSGYVAICCWLLLLYLSGYVVMLLPPAPLPVWICCHCCWCLLLYISGHVAFSWCLPLPFWIFCLVIGFAPLPVLICCHCCWLLILYPSWYVAIVVGVCSSTFLDMLSLLLTSAPLPVWKFRHCCWCLHFYLSGYVAVVVRFAPSTCPDILPLLLVCLLLYLSAYVALLGLLLYLFGYVVIVGGVRSYMSGYVEFLFVSSSICLEMLPLLLGLLLYLSGHVAIAAGFGSSSCLEMLPLLLVSAPLHFWTCCILLVSSSTCLGMLSLLLAPDPLPVLICCHCCWHLILYLSWYVVAVLWSLLFFLHLKTMLLIFTLLTVKLSPRHLSGDVAAVVDVYHLEDGPGVQFWDVGASSRGLELHPTSCFNLLHHLLITVVKNAVFCRTFQSIRTVQ